MKKYKKFLNPNGITPQSLESNDGRFFIEIIEDGLFQVVILDDANESISDNGSQEFMLTPDDLSRLKELLILADKTINPYRLETLKVKIGDEMACKSKGKKKK